MTDNVFDMLIVPQDVMHTCAKRARDLRLSQNITQKELAERVGVAEGTPAQPRKKAFAERAWFNRFGES